MDPVTLIGVASAAFKGIKSAVEAGREIEDMVESLSKWAGAVSDIGKAEELNNKKRGKLFSGQSVEQEAMQIFAAKQAARKQRDELRMLIQYTTGKNGWEEFLHMEAEIVKRRQQEVYAAIERKERIKEYLLAAVITIGTIAVVGGAITLIVMIKQAGQ